MSDNKNDIGKMVRDRASDLASQPPAKIEVDGKFVKACLDLNERGDGMLFATVNQGKFIYNTTPKDGRWYAWDKHVWRDDYLRWAWDAAEEVALLYDAPGQDLQKDIAENEIDKKHDDAWKIDLAKKYINRASRCRSRVGVASMLCWAPIVLNDMACRESDFDNLPWLLPVANGVIDLESGTLVDGHPEDLLTKALDIDFDPGADYGPWVKFLNEISGSKKVEPFLKRLFGAAITGFSTEQFVAIFIGPGRNGKGVLFDLIGDVMASYYHEISRSMILEQRSEPSPSASSEHKYSLMGKRIIVGSETNKKHRIDTGAVKALTGEDRINCRPNFGSEIVFTPTHNVFLHTNNVPKGMTEDFALLQRMIVINFPYIFVDDVEAEQEKHPAKKDRFRKKDMNLKKHLRKYKPGILRWLVEGCRDWQKDGLSPPACVLQELELLSKDEDYLSEFVRDCLEVDQIDSIKLPAPEMYQAFNWWWSENMDARERAVPSVRTITKDLRTKGFQIEKIGGRAQIFNTMLKMEVDNSVAEYLKKRGKR